ncbi:hypothetical protein QJQ45_028741 [Haematococcus lacustris]|nr:hypothetical protein QJQ45_028741 [Haematococcus lacustris]
MQHPGEGLWRSLQMRQDRLPRAQQQQLAAQFCVPCFSRVLHTDIDLLNPPAELEKSKHKLKRLVQVRTQYVSLGNCSRRCAVLANLAKAPAPTCPQSPNSYFMDVKCQGCFNITTVFSHSQSVVLCASCSTVLCTPTGGRARLTEGACRSLSLAKRLEQLVVVATLVEPRSLDAQAARSDERLIDGCDGL